MELYISNKAFKRVPKKYAQLQNITHHLEDEFTYNLTTAERNNLRWALFHQQVQQSFLNRFLHDHPLEAEQIGGAKAIGVTKVTTNDGQQYFVLQFSNGAAVRCPGHLFALSPVQQRHNYASSLNNRKIPPPVPSSSNSLLTLPIEIS